MKSIKISKLGCKIMSGLTACIIGLSPCIGTQVSAIWIPSAEQNIDIENCSEKQLLEVLPGLWKNYWNAWFVVRNLGASGIAFDSQFRVSDATNNCLFYDIFDESENVANKVVRSADRDATFNTNFTSNWKPGGAKYVQITKVSKFYGRAYFQNLVRVLEEQIDFLRNQATFFRNTINGNNQTQDSHQTINTESLRELPDLWFRYQAARHDFGKFFKFGASDVSLIAGKVYIVAMDAAAKASGSDICEGKGHSSAAYNTYFARSWGPGGAAYDEIIDHPETYNGTYIDKLSSALKEQTAIMLQQ